MEINGLYIVEAVKKVYHISDPTGVFATLIIGDQKGFLVDTASGAFDLAGVVNVLCPLPLTVVNTHGHLDSMGGNGQFERVYLPRADFECAKSSTSAENKHRIIESIPEVWEKSAQRETFLNYELENVVPLDASMRFALGGETVVPVPIPNHTAGSMGFLCERKRLLIAGDSISSWMMLHYPESCGIKAHIELLKQLQADDRFDFFLCNRSGRLWRKEAIDMYIACAENALIGRSIRCEDPFFPETAARKYIYHSRQSIGDCAVILFDPNKS